MTHGIRARNPRERISRAHFRSDGVGLKLAGWEPFLRADASG